MTAGSNPKPSLYGWEQLLCEYFELTVVEVLDDYFEAKGFQYFYREFGCKVRFMMADIFVDISYLLETAPDYEILLAIGRTNPDGGTGDWILPIWSLMPAEHPAQASTSWRFNSPEKLEEMLIRLKEEVLIPFAEPLLCDSEALSLQLDRCRKQSNEAERVHFDAVALHRKQEKLEMRWNADDYSGFVEVFENEVSINDQLPASVHLKYEIAKSRK